MTKKKIAVIGCCGKMGQVTCSYLLDHPDYQLESCIDVTNVGKDIGEIIGKGYAGLNISSNLILAIQNTDIAIDFTAPDVVVKNASICIKNSVQVLIGTTGIVAEDAEKIDLLARQNNVSVMIVPNFAIGAILMMDFAKKAARFIKDAEIIEMHHPQKKDRPSGTAIKTRLGMLEEQGKSPEDKDSIPIHSLRITGMVAHQEVIFGTTGQTLTIRHDSFNRESFMPGIGLALSQINDFKGLRYGLEV
jgi:4-hydroxy-tetrahydrodipicolinate reductase